MSDPGGIHEGKTIGLLAEGLRSPLAAFAELHGHRVVDAGAPGAVDLVIVELDGPAPLPVSHPAPILVVSTRRLRPGDVGALRAGGAARVLDGDASLLEVGFALDELAPAGSRSRRGERFDGGLPVAFVLPGGPEAGAQQAGRLVSVRRGGAYVRTSAPTPAAGVPLSLELRLGAATASLRCRVACCVSAEGRAGFGVEFAMDAPDVAPGLAALAAPDRSRGPSRVGRSPSVARSSA